MGDLRAIIDIGSNTVRLVVYNGPLRAPIVVLNEKVTPRLGRDVSQTGLLADNSMETALAALARYAALLELMSVSDVQTVATAAVRDAENGRDFLEAVAALGLEPRLLSGDDEACASAMGVIAAFPGAHGIVGDLGGGSLELVPIADGTCGTGITLPFGTLRLPPLREDGEEIFTLHVATALEETGWNEAEKQPLYIVGGSWRALALYAMHVVDWPLDDPHDMELSPKDALRICDALAQDGPDEEVPRISSSRLATLPDAAALLAALVRSVKPSRIVFSSWGLREGLLYASLDKATQKQDPMLAGVKAFAARYDVSAEAAQMASRWVGTILPKMRKVDANLRQAAAMLAMAAMRAEPNVRTEEVLSWALGKRWIGLDSRGRALIAMAALANTGVTQVPEPLKGLAKAGELKWAVAWGLALRVCRKLTNFTPDALQGTSLEIEDGRLVLRLEGEATALVNASVEKNLGRLADWLELEWEVRRAEFARQRD